MYYVAQCCLPAVLQRIGNTCIGWIIGTPLHPSSPQHLLRQASKVEKSAVIQLTPDMLCFTPPLWKKIPLSRIQNYKTEKQFFSPGCQSRYSTYPTQRVSLTFKEKAQNLVNLNTTNWHQFTARKYSHRYTDCLLQNIQKDSKTDITEQITEYNYI